MTATETKDDPEHVSRLMRAFIVAVPPVWIALLVTGFVLKSVFWSIVALVTMLPPSVAYLHRVAFTGICPACTTRIPISPMQDRYSCGDAYTYNCPDCGTLWRTRLRPGGYDS